MVCAAQHPSLTIQSNRLMQIIVPVTFAGWQMYPCGRRFTEYMAGVIAPLPSIMCAGLQSDPRVIITPLPSSFSLPGPDLPSSHLSPLSFYYHPSKSLPPTKNIRTMSNSWGKPGSNNPNAPQFPPGQHAAEKSIFAGILVGAIVYGMPPHVSLYLHCSPVLFIVSF